VKTGKILVIDDDSRIRRVLQMMLARESYESAAPLPEKRH
jgi:DNA-binding NtrC family response regulator